MRYADDVPCSIRAHHERTSDGADAWCVWCGLLFRPQRRHAPAGRVSTKRKGRGRRTTRQLLASQGHRCAECSHEFGPKDDVHRYHHMLFCGQCMSIIAELERTDTFRGVPAIRLPRHT